MKKPSKQSSQSPSGALAVVVLAAGRGERMQSDLAKVLHPVAGRPMIAHVLAAASALKPAQTVVVVGQGMVAVAETVAQSVIGARTVVQHPALGTGDAVKVAGRLLKSMPGCNTLGDVLVLYGDVPLITPETLRAMRAAKRADPSPALVVLGFRTKTPAQYGRLILNADGRIERIVERADASPLERKIELCNAGAMLVDGAALWRLLKSIGNSNRNREFYLTDIVAAARAEGLEAAVVVAPSSAEALGVNTRAELAKAEAIMQARLRARALAQGATLIDPDTVWFSFDTQLARDVVVEPGVIFGPGVRVGKAARIRGFSHLEGAQVGAGAIVGPFARLRPGAQLAEGAHIGNFVEIKQSRIGRGAKVNHLAYVGDASVGQRANVGAGTITCNFDGERKHKTEIGAGAFIGSNASLVAPVKIGANAIIGAGSVIVRNVKPNALAVERSAQIERPGWAKKRPAKKGPVKKSLAKARKA